MNLILFIFYMFIQNYSVKKLRILINYGLSNRKVSGENKSIEFLKRSFFSSIY
jgi:hypothetical protein